MENLSLLGFVFSGGKFGLTTLDVSDRFCNAQRSWRSEERCTAVLFESVFVMAVHAPDPGKDLEEYEKLMKETTNNLHEGRRAGAKRFYIAGDLNIELGFLCTGDDDVEEVSEMY